MNARFPSQWWTTALYIAAERLMRVVWCSKTSSPWVYSCDSSFKWVHLPWKDTISHETNDLMFSLASVILMSGIRRCTKSLLEKCAVSLVGFSGGCQGVAMWFLGSSRQLLGYFEWVLAHCYAVFMLCGLLSGHCNVVQRCSEWFLVHCSAVTSKLLM